MYPEWLKDKTIAVLDLETDYIPTTQIFCNSITVIKNGDVVVPVKLYTQYWTPYSHGSLQESIKVVNECDYVCAHNLCGFDNGEIEKYLTKLLPKQLDTLILAKLIFSKDDLYAMDVGLGVDKDMLGKYSLKAFGQRFGDHKLDYTDFSHLNEEMGIYCNQDTELAARLLVFLLEKEHFPTEQVIKMEHDVANIIYKQTQFGFYLDKELTVKLDTDLLKEKGELSRKLLEIFHPKFLKDGAEKSYKKVSTVRKYIENKNWKKSW